MACSQLAPVVSYHLLSEADRLWHRGIARPQWVTARPYGRSASGALTREDGRYPAETDGQPTRSRSASSERARTEHPGHTTHPAEGSRTARRHEGLRRIGTMKGSGSHRTPCEARWLPNLSLTTGTSCGPVAGVLSTVPAA